MEKRWVNRQKHHNLVPNRKALEIFENKAIENNLFCPG